MGMVRSPVVAGTFYEADPARLETCLNQYLAPQARQPARGVLVPHAGYIYSGEVAGAVYSRIVIPESYVILGPNHTGCGSVASILCHGSWETPLGSMEIDTELASSILDGSRIVKEDAEAHRNEHAIEVQLPFLQALGGGSFVPLTLMGVDFESCRDVAKAVVRAVRNSGKSVLIVASSDMTHYESRDSASVKDRLALDRVEQLDPRGLYDVVRKRRISMCGFIPATIMLLAVRELGAEKASVVRYANSGDVTGDYDQVVGYAGVIVE